jgi:hypothetical protein
MFDTQRDQLLQNLDVAHAAYYRAEIFGGPSLYFHLEALLAASCRDFERFAEVVYAVLAAWGMHRMGPRGSKMREFEDLLESLRSLWPIVLNLQQASPENLDRSGWDDLRKVFSEVRCMASKTSLVGNSKVMAHAIPNLAAPVDRQYTLEFLYGTSSVTNNIEKEWQKFQDIHRYFFYPLQLSELFRSKAEAWMPQTDEFRWDTSHLKILDNLLIGFVKHTTPKK